MRNPFPIVVKGRRQNQFKKLQKSTPNFIELIAKVAHTTMLKPKTNVLRTWTPSTCTEFHWLDGPCHALTCGCVSSLPCTHAGIANVLILLNCLDKHIAMWTSFGFNAKTQCKDSMHSAIAMLQCSVNQMFCQSSWSDNMDTFDAWFVSCVAKATWEQWVPRQHLLKWHSKMVSNYSCKCDKHVIH